MLKMCANLSEESSFVSLQTLSQTLKQFSSFSLQKIAPLLCIMEMPRFPCQIRTTLWNHTDCTYLYSTTSHNRKIFRPKTQKKKFLGICALLWKTCSLCCSLSSLKHAQKISLTLFSMCSQVSTSSRCLHNMSCTLPNAFFYNLKMTFSPQKCLFTFLNPRSKGQD
jgi:hypothetical protein